MAKAKKIGDWNAVDSEESVAIFCPGCKYYHAIPTKVGLEKSWTYNGDMDKPTFRPSLLLRTGSHSDPNYIDDPECPPSTCHSHITDGYIQFAIDSTHHLTGQTVLLPDIKPD